MRKSLILATVALLALAGCGKGSESASSDGTGISPSDATAIKMDSEFAYQAAIGNPGTEGHSDSPDIFKKKLGTSVGTQIIIPKFYIWSLDSSEWEKGGKLHIVNDNSLGAEYGVTCSLSSSDGDKIMKTKQRREVDIKGTIASYSSRDGLIIDPCVITRDELDSPSPSNQSDKQQDEETKKPAPVPPTDSAPTPPTAAVISSGPFTPSFDCSKASSGQEKMVCSDRDLAKLDVTLHSLYVQSRDKAADKKAMLDSQRAWIKGSFNACSDKACLVSAYNSRIAELGR